MNYQQALFVIHAHIAVNANDPEIYVPFIAQIALLTQTRSCRQLAFKQLMVAAGKPVASIPTKAASASKKLPVDTHIKYSQGISSSVFFILRRYGDRIEELK